ncbi:MAG TPA: hypothetical protein VFE46_10765 [Pirellulales bacterium]|jgi:hypothetical protein|nr:hypothetical protein [Pirellulales bacterium]
MESALIGLRYETYVQNEVSEAVWNDCMEEAEIAELAYWKIKYLPEHFTRNARDKYGYQPRSEKYIRRKQYEGRRGKAKYGGEVDLVFSGESEEILHGPASIVAHPSGAEMDMPIPPYFADMRWPSSPDPEPEVTAVTDEEMEELAEHFSQVFQQALDRHLQGNGWQKI